MAWIIDEVLAAEREHSLGIHPLAAADRNLMRERLSSWYAGNPDRMWEAVRGCTSVQNSEAWRWIGEFVGPRSCVLLFDLCEEIEMLHVPSGVSLLHLLGNTFGFEFYVTDTAASYLIAFNDNDFLVCCGSAKEWLEAYAVA